MDELHSFDDEKEAEVFAEKNGYDIFTLNVKSQKAVFKASFGTVWDVEKRGPLTKYDLQYLGYWSPHVLYIKRPQFEKCGFSGVVCGFGFPTEQVLFCPEHECAMNACCTDVTPFTSTTMTTTGSITSTSSTGTTTTHTGSTGAS